MDVPHGDLRRPHVPVVTPACPTGKVQHRTRGKALRALSRSRSGILAGVYPTGSTGKVPEHVYRCPLCQHWHLTSQAPRYVNGVRTRTPEETE